MPGFSKQNRLLKRPEFLRCYNAGKRCFTSSFIVFVLPTEGAVWRLGLAVTRKVGGAVQRNRIKRLLREFFRLHQHLVPAGMELAVVPKKGIRPDELTYGDVERELLSLLTGLFERAGKLAGRPLSEVLPALSHEAPGKQPRRGKAAKRPGSALPGTAS